MIPDFSTKQIINTIGAKEERTGIKAGAAGKIIGEFADDEETIDYSSVMLIETPILKKPASILKECQFAKNLRQFVLLFLLLLLKS